ncbi:MAG: transcriptional regulator GcvA [Pseudomonadota bacterium]
MNLTERLPSLTALRAFEAAQRHMSFAKAAEELFVTPAALSYQIKSLEQELGVTLFRRLNRAVELTEAGRVLAPDVIAAFEALREGARKVHRLRQDRPFAVTAGPAFTAKWLAPRIFRFAEKHPEFEVRLLTSLKKMDFDRDNVDVAIRFTREDDEPGCYVETLIEEVMTPLCTPEMARRLKTPEDLRNVTLFHDDNLAIMAEAPDWGSWLRAAGIEMDYSHGARFSNADQVLAAAIGGGGVALGRMSIAHDDVEAGRLVAPFPLAIDSRAHFNFVCKAGDETRIRHGAFLAWLREELKDEGAVREGLTVVHV